MTEETAGTTSALLVDRYRDDGPLGEGAFGTVIRAFDTRLKRPVAIKRLKRSLASEDRDLLRTLTDRFTREAEAGSRMGIHPNLVAVYDLATDAERTQYLILEFIPGGTLDGRLTKGPLSVTDALRLTADIARGLQAAHEVGIVHRDLKPGNIFIAADGRAQVGDFGIAQIDHLSGRTYALVTHPGTPLYMSPEQERGPGYLHPTSDQYSLGLVLFEMLTRQIYKRLLSREAEELLAKQPLAVTAFIRRMLAEDANDRYAAMTDVMQAAITITRSLPEEGPAAQQDVPPDDDAETRLAQVPAVMPGPAPPGTPPIYWPGGPASAPGNIRAVALPRILLGHTNWVLCVAFSPDGQTLASGSVDRTVRLWRPRDGVPLGTLTGHLDWVRGVAFSPDGAHFVSGGDDDTIRPWRIQDGAPLGTLTAYARGVSGVAFSPKSDILASASRDRTLRLWRAQDGVAIRTLAGHTGEVNAVAFARDGALLASASEDRTVRLWQVNDYAVPWVLPGHMRGVTSLAFAPDADILASASDDRTIRFWRIPDGAPLGLLYGPVKGIRCIAFAPDGKLLAAGADDGIVHLWRPSDGVALGMLVGHAKGILSVAFAPDGRTLASGSADGTIRLWALGEQTQSG